ncbi:hypothetical protein ACTA71_003320 [Dictyostelium dimigraforme]
MKQVIALFFLFLFLNLKVQSLRAPNPVSIISSPTNITYRFKGTESYYTSWTMKYNSSTPVDVQVSFDCGGASGGFRNCYLITNRPMSRLFGTTASTFCAADSTGQVCFISMETAKIASPINVKFNGKPSTNGGTVIVTGNYLRLISQQLNIIQSSTNATIKVIGNFEDPKFDCNNLTLLFPPGSGKMDLMFDLVKKFEISYASPIINSILYDQNNSKISISGDNFYSQKQLVNILFDGVSQNTFSITQNDTLIEVNDFNQNIGGPMQIQISVNNISMDTPYSYCFPPVLSSINSISNHMGGIVTIKGSLFNNDSGIIKVTIGNLDCKLINSTLNEIQCQLDPNEIIETNLNVKVNIGGCIDNSNLTFSFGKPILYSHSPIQPDDTTVTLVGINFGFINETIIKIEGINDSIIPNSISNDETHLIFNLQKLKCKPTISIVHNNLSSNSIIIQTPLFITTLDTPFVSNTSSLNIDLINYDCSNSGKVWSIIDSSSKNEITCSKPTNQPNSEYYSTICQIPPGTGKHIVHINYQSENASTQFSYMAPSMTSFEINNMTVTVNGFNFGTEISLLKVDFSGRNPQILTINDKKFTFTLLESDSNSPLNITVDGIESQSSIEIIKPTPSQTPSNKPIITPSPTSLPPPPPNPIPVEKTNSSALILSFDYKLIFFISIFHLIYKLFI